MNNLKGVKINNGKSQFEFVFDVRQAKYSEAGAKRDESTKEQIDIKKKALKKLSDFKEKYVSNESEDIEAFLVMLDQNGNFIH